MALECQISGNTMNSKLVTDAVAVGAGEGEG